MSVEVVKKTPNSTSLDQPVKMQEVIELLHVTFWIVCWFATRATYAAVPVMLLWNWVMPDLIGVKPLDYWHALGLSLLCTALFKSNFLEEQKKTFIPAFTKFIEEQNKNKVEKLGRRLAQGESKLL